MSFADTTYFCGLDMYEALAHEMALVHLDESGAIRPGRATMRDLPFRKLIGDPFDLGRRPVLPVDQHAHDPTYRPRRFVHPSPARFEQRCRRR
jgi:hypothetical protein